MYLVKLLSCFLFRGESGIRTRDTLLAYTRFPGVPLQPLEHLSFERNPFLFKNGCKVRKIYYIQIIFEINFIVMNDFFYKISFETY